MSSPSPPASPSGAYLSYHNSLLHRDDVDLLRGPFWLNDQLISFYLEYLEHDLFGLHEASLLFVSPEVTQCMKLIPADETGVFLDPLGAASKQFIFFPINDHELDTAGGSHWSLLVYSRPDRQYYSADSYGVCNLNATRSFVANVHQALGAGGGSGAPPEVRRLRCVQQQNGYDCGVHVLWNVAWLARHAMQTGSLLALADLGGRGPMTRSVSGAGTAAVLGEHEAVGDLRGEMLQLIERLRRESRSK